MPYKEYLILGSVGAYVAKQLEECIPCVLRQDPLSDDVQVQLTTSKQIPLLRITELLRVSCFVSAVQTYLYTVLLMLQIEVAMDCDMLRQD